MIQIDLIGLTIDPIFDTTPDSGLGQRLVHDYLILALKKSSKMELHLVTRIFDDQMVSINDRDFQTLSDQVLCKFREIQFDA